MRMQEAMAMIGATSVAKARGYRVSFEYKACCARDYFPERSEASIADLEDAWKLAARFANVNPELYVNIYVINAHDWTPVEDHTKRELNRWPPQVWPEAVSDGLTLPCNDCGQVPRFDYNVTDEFWKLHVSDRPAYLSVVCLPCLDKRCGGVGLADALNEIQWTGTGHTVVLKPTLRHVYEAKR
jgi:hypothetical protein